MSQSAKKQIQEDADKLGFEIAAGRCKDFGEYKRMCGERAGLLKALQAIEDARPGNVLDHDEE